MSHRLLLAIAVTGLIASSFDSQVALGQVNRDRGTVLGGLSGAAIGAAIGNQNGETTEGAVIGGVLGALSGAVIGNSVDREEAQVRAYQQQRQAVALSQAVSLADVVTLSRNGVGDAVIINQIRQRGVQQRLEVSDVIALHQQGVSEIVITELQRTPVAQPAPTVDPRSYSAPVIVEQYHYVAPRPHHYHPPHPYYRSRYYHPHARGPRSAAHFGFSFGH